MKFGRSSDSTSVNECRRKLFAKKDCDLQNIPPTADALKQHSLRAAFQANIWRQAVKPDQCIPNPEDWGWKKIENGFEPVWTTAIAAGEATHAYIKCACKKVSCTSDSSKCKCKKNNVSCCQLCSCACMENGKT